MSETRGIAGAVTGHTATHTFGEEVHKEEQQTHEIGEESADGVALCGVERVRRKTGHTQHQNRAADQIPAAQHSTAQHRTARHSIA